MLDKEYYIETDRCYTQYEFGYIEGPVEFIIKCLLVNIDVNIDLDHRKETS